MDIATWGLGKTETGPVAIDPMMVRHPVEFKDGYPVDPSRYNTATQFLIRTCDLISMVMATLKRDGHSIDYSVTSMEIELSMQQTRPSLPTRFAESCVTTPR